MVSIIQIVYDSVDSICLDESIQELIKDMKATQHGDRTNPLYELAKDYHKEGGVWKHTLLALQALPEVASALGPDFYDIYLSNVNDLRAAVLYHDIGKLVTKTSSKTRPGSYSFPQHSAEDIMDSMAVHYGITMSPIVRRLATHHHDSPDLFKKLPEDFQKLLVIVKAADAFAVGPTDVASAIEHVRPFLKGK